MSGKTDSIRELPPESILSGFKNRLLQFLARQGPGAHAWRVRLHRWRGVRIGAGVHIGIDVIIETAYPQWVSIGNGVSLGMRTTIIAHMHGLAPKRREHKGYVSVRIEDDVNIGAGVIILPNVVIGQGAVVAAGTVVSRSVPPLTMIQGNPAQPIAHCGIPLTWDTPIKDFYKNLRPIPQP